MLILDPVLRAFPPPSCLKPQASHIPTLDTVRFESHPDLTRYPRPAVATAVDGYFPQSFTASWKEKNQRINPQRGPKRNFGHRQKPCNERERAGRPLICQERDTRQNSENPADHRQDHQAAINNVEITHQRKRIGDSTQQRPKHDRSRPTEKNQPNPHADPQHSVNHPADTQDSPMITQIARPHFIQWHPVSRWSAPLSCPAVGLIAYALPTVCPLWNICGCQVAQTQEPTLANRAWGTLRVSTLSESATVVSSHRALPA